MPGCSWFCAWPNSLHGRKTKKTQHIHIRNPEELPVSTPSVPSKPENPNYTSNLPNIRQIGDLKPDVQKKVRKSEIPDQVLEANLPILLNILRLVVDEEYVCDETKHLPPWRPTSDKAPKWIRKKAGTVNHKCFANYYEETTINMDDTKKKYKKLDLTGKGGFGRVYYTTVAKTKQQVAIKKMPHMSEKEKKNNLGEAGYLSLCDHPNIVKYYWSHIVRDEMWIVTEFLEGGTLTDAVKAYPFEESHVAFIAREVLRGLEYLHSKNLVHRDLKSANIMMSIEAEIKLIDFGLCIDVSSGPSSRMSGSPFWMPPEMIMPRRTHSFPADIWSLGICLVEMVTKEPPHRQSRIRAMFVAGTVGFEGLPQPEKYSNDFKDFLSKLLIKEPEERGTASELLKHPFLLQAEKEVSMKDVLKSIFVSNTLAMSGFG